MADNASELNPDWLHGKARAGITAGASAPEVLVQAVIDKLKALGADSVRDVESAHFAQRDRSFRESVTDLGMLHE